MAANAATHGISRTVKHRKANADSGVNIVCSTLLSPASVDAPVRMDKVLTTLSWR